MTKICGLCGHPVEAEAFDEHLLAHQRVTRSPRVSRGLATSCAGCLVSVAAVLLAGMASLGTAMSNSYSRAEQSEVGWWLWLMLLAVVCFDVALVGIARRWAYAGRAAALCMLLTVLALVKAGTV